MALRVLMTETVTQDLLFRVLSTLSSASGALTPDQLNDAITAKVEPHRGFQYATNNDLGLCVDRLLASCEHAGITTVAALAEAYPTLCSEDPIVVEAMNKVVHGISRQFSAPLYDIRVVLPEEAKLLATEVLNRIPPELQTAGQAELQPFSWGKLASMSAQHAAVLLAQDRLNCLRGGKATQFDTSKILAALPFGAAKEVPGAKTLRSALLEELKACVSDSPVHELAADVVLVPNLYRGWGLNMRAALQRKDIAAAVVEVTNKIDALETLLEAVNATMLTKIGADAAQTSTSILANIETVSENIALLRAAMLHHKEITLADRLLLSPTVVQEQVMTTFLSNGGSEGMIHDYISYLHLNTHLTVPPTGVTADSIREIHPRASKAVVDQAGRLKEITAARRAIALQNTVAHYLDQRYEMLRRTENVVISSEEHHVNQRQRALASLTQKSLEDVALEYLVSQRQHPLAAPLYKTISSELLELVKQDVAITKVEVSRATCSAVASTLMSMLTTKLAQPLAA